MLHRNPRGLSLLEVVIAMGVISGLMLVVTQLQINSVKSTNEARGSSDFVNLQAVLQILMQNQAACTGNFAGKTFNSTLGTLGAQVIQIAQLTYPTGGILVKNGQPYATNLKITKLELDQFQQIVAGTNYLAMIHVEGTKSANTYMGSPLITIDVPVALQTIPAGPPNVSIQACGMPVSLSGLQCVDYTAANNFAASVSCTPAYPNPLRGGCNNPGCPDGGGWDNNWLGRDELVGNTQFCVEGGQHLGECVGGGQGVVQARITCCQ